MLAEAITEADLTTDALMEAAAETLMVSELTLMGSPERFMSSLPTELFR